MTDMELLEKVLASQGVLDERRNEYETTVELAARLLHVLMLFVVNDIGVLDQLTLLNKLEESRTQGEWRTAELMT
jgi:hypothetical protein